MKIGLCGAGGTGKTEVAKGLSTRLSVPYYPLVPRQVFAAEGLTEADQRSMSYEEKYALQCKIFDAKISQMEQNSSGVFDRTLADHMAYCLFRCDLAIDSAELTRLMDWMFRELSTYTAVVYFPVYFSDRWPEKRDDKMVEQHKAYRVASGSLMRGLLEDWGGFYYVAEDCPVEDRVSMIFSNL